MERRKQIETETRKSILVSRITIACLQTVPGIQKSEVEDAGQVGEKSVEQSGHGTDKKTVTGSALLVVLRAVCNSGNMALYTGVASLCELLESEHASALHICKTNRGCVEWHLQMHAGHRVSVVESLWLRLCSRDFCAALSMLDTGGPPQMLLKSDTGSEVCECMFQFVLALATKEILLQEEYAQHPPNCFIGLLSSSASVRARTLRYCKALWDQLLVLESDALHNVRMKSFLTSLIWPSLGWNRELLMGATEMRWESLPRVFHDELLHYTMSNGSKLIEDLINEARMQTTTNCYRKGHLAQLALWQRLNVSGIIEDCDVLPVPEGAPSEVHGLPPLRNELLHCSHSVCSLGEPSLDAMLTATDFQHPSPAKLAELPVRTSLFMTIVAGSDPSIATYSVLAQRGYLLRQ
eukprot:6029843-Amphidinium_carterae.2